MRRVALLTSALVLVALSAGPASAAQAQMHVEIPGEGTYSLEGFSAWDPDSGTASWCAGDDCSANAAILLPPGGGTGSFTTGADTAFVLTSTTDDLQVASVAGECVIEVRERTDVTLVGSAMCRDVPVASGKTVDLAARFRANALSQPVGQLPGMATPPEGEAPASGSEQIHSYDVDIEVRPDGVLEITETIDYDFGAYAVDRHGIFRDIPNRFYHDETQDRVMPIEVFSSQVTGDASADYAVENLGDGQLRIKVGDADRTVEGRHTYTLTYTVEGALNAFGDHDELYWNAIGTNWGVRISDASVLVKIPEGGEIQQAACYAGYAGSSEACDRGPEVIGSSVEFEQDALGPHQGLTVVVAMDKGLVMPEPQPVLVERWAIARAFSLSPATGAMSGGLLILVIAGFVVLLLRNGRDRRYAGGAVNASLGSEGMPEEAVPLFEGDEMPIEYEPPDDIRPGQMGTLIDEIANPLDVSATIVDLAVRGFITIEEIPKEGLFGKPDWRLSRAAEPPQLIEYERRLYDAIWAEAGGDSVLLSELKTKFADRLKTVQDALYRDAVRRKWFTTSPSEIRGRWQAGGWILVALGAAATFALAKWTHLGLIGIPFVVGGLLFAVGARWMPRRTARGTAMVRRVKGFRRFIESPTQAGLAQMSERENLFSAYLPYAIVFGLTDKWAKAFQDLGMDPAESSWFIASRRMAYVDFGEAFGDFATVASGTVAATPASSGSSGFGGGGFSGGGGGGGGGGSW